MRRRFELIAPLLAFGIGVGPGFYVGRVMLETKWRDGVQPLTVAEVERSSVPGADPTPKVGTKVVHEMPIGRARVALAELTAKDPVKVTLGSFGRDASKTELHLNLRNDAPCEVIAVEGVAYGFDPWGRPTAVNKAGENYVAFSKAGLSIVPGAKGYLEEEVHFAPLATMALAQIDSYVCTDGRIWRPLR